MQMRTIFKVLLNLLQYCLCSIFWSFCQETLRTQLSNQRSNLHRLHWKVKFNHWITREVPLLSFTTMLSEACALSCFSHVQHFETLSTIACQVLLSMGFSSQVYWNGFPCPPPGDQGSPAQGLNLHVLCLLHCRQVLYPLSHLGSPYLLVKS